ncbi:MAG: right-handed parallel beta-helix repeat-containing protein [Phycisphaerales bacterium]
MTRSSMVKVSLIGSIAAVTLFASPSLAQRVWFVDDDAPGDPGPGDPLVSDPNEDGSIAHPFDAIAEAVGRAADGDVVLVRDGVYTGSGNHDIDFEGRLILVRSENGPESCIIDCQRRGRAFFLDQGETADAVIEGFTITNGFAESSNGGAIDCTLDSSPTIRDCRFIDNEAAGLGGAVALRGGSRSIVSNCHFEGNVCFGASEGSQGGALSCFFLAHATVVNCTFLNNSSQWGGAVDASLSEPVFVNCVFVDNFATHAGGAIFMSAARPTFINCTAAFNIAQSGGGMALVGAVLPSFAFADNCVFWGDAPNEISIGLGEATLTYSLVMGGWPGEGNIDADPLLIDAFNGDVRLSEASPCIDAGHNGALPLFATADRYGAPRFVDDPDTPDTGLGASPVVDIGASEFYGDEFVLFRPAPGLVARSNRIVAENAPPGATVYFAWGLRGGSTTVPGCAGVTIDIESARLAGSAVADAGGAAVFELLAPLTARGASVLLQAVERENCRTTNLVSLRFP